MLKKNIKGITLLETFLASFIFVISVSAIFASIVSLRRPAVHNEQEVGAALAGRQIFEDLRSKIDTQERNCPGGTGDDYCGEMSNQVAHTNTVGIYNIDYNVRCVDSADQYIDCDPDVVRKVEATITWPDAMPPSP